MSDLRIGPALAIVGTCEGCCHCRIHNGALRCMGTKERRALTGLRLRAPEWCPELAPARLALGQALVADDITGPARGVEGQGCCPDVSTLEATEARFACKVAMGLVK